MVLLFKYTSRSRPEQFFAGLDSIVNNLSDRERFMISCTLDQDDMSMNNPAVIERIERYPNTTIKWGFSKSKIDAINRDIPAEGWDVLINMSDDMRFIAYGFDDLIRDGFRINAPDLDGFLHYPDSTAKNALCTLSIIGKRYFDRDGYIYHPSYLSLHCDNEAMEVAQLRGKYRYMGIQLFDHLHPAYGLAQWDEQYRMQQNLWNVDEQNINTRRARRFDLIFKADGTIDLDTDSVRTSGAVSEAAFAPDETDLGIEGREVGRNSMATGQQGDEYRPQAEGSV